MKYIIFGGNGFVGRYLVNDLINDGHEVLVADIMPKIDAYINKKAGFISVDIRNIDMLRRVKILADDVVINLAATQYHTKVPKNRKDYFFYTNFIGTKNILEVMTEAGCNHYIMFSTDMIYGKPMYLPVDTNHPQNPFGPYGQSKKACEDLCREYRKKGMHITIFRPRMINGPGRLGILIKLFKLINLNLPIPTIGNGRNHYQMVSVFDCVSAIRAAINKGFPQKEYNLGSGDSPNVRDLLHDIIKSAGKHSVILPTPGKLVKYLLKCFDIVGLTLMYPEQYMIADEEYILDISDTEKDLDWHPKYNDADMMKDAYKMYKKTHE